MTAYCLSPLVHSVGNVPRDWDGPIPVQCLWCTHWFYSPLSVAFSGVSIHQTSRGSGLTVPFQKNNEKQPFNHPRQLWWDLASQSFGWLVHRSMNEFVSGVYFCSLSVLSCWLLWPVHFSCSGLFLSCFFALSFRRNVFPSSVCVCLSLSLSAQFNRNWLYYINI